MSIAFKDGSELNSEEWSTREQILRRFEAAWQAGPQPLVEDYLPADELMRPSVLVELVHVDLEYRLKRGEKARVEQYLERFPELESDLTAKLELIEAELEMRRRLEPGLALDEFLARFHRYDAELRSTWKRTDQSGPTLRPTPSCWQCNGALEFSADEPDLLVVCPSCGAKNTPRRNPLPKALAVPPPLGKYEPLEELGRGAYGTVYRARDTVLHRIVALKILHEAHQDSPAAVDRFLREARAAAQLDHPHIVRIFDFDRDVKTCYLVYAFVPGTTLTRHMASGGLPFREAAALVAKMAEALHYAHRQGVIHRDVKPANILLDGQGEPHLTDFGLARRDTGEITMTGSRDILGTPAYMPPEQARGEAHRVDGRSDLYSLGVILYQMLTGTLPFWADSSQMVLKKVLEEEPQPPRRLNDRVPRDLETICLKCLEKEPARRFASAEAMAEDLARFSRGEPILARPVGKFERGARWCRRRPAVAALLSVVVVGFAFSAWLIGHSRVNYELARTSAKKAEALLEGSVAILKSDLEQATNERESLLFMRKDYRDKLLKQIDGLRMLLDREPQNTYGAALRVRAVYVLGWGYSLTESRTEAKETLAEAIKLGEDLRSIDPRDQELAGTLTSCHNLLANVFCDEHSWQEAERHYQETIRLCGDLIDDQRKSTDLGDCLIDQANNFRHQGSESEARRLYSDALEIFADLRRENPQNSHFIRANAITLANLGELDMPQRWSRQPSDEEMNEADGVRRRFEAAIHSYDLLHPDPDSTPRIALERAACYRNLSKIERRLRNFEEAATAGARAVDELKSVVKFHPGVAECHYRLAQAYDNLALAKGHAGRRNDALLAHKEAGAELDEVFRLSPNFPDHEDLRNIIPHNQEFTESRIRATD
jgi:serine/threonine protein kinase